MVQACRRCGLRHDAYMGCAHAMRVGRSTVVGEDDALVGSIVGDRYRVDEILGVGSTGTVFGVEHTTFARPAAMKVLRPRYADEEVVSRVFHGEARAAWSVNHPCLCEVFDIGTLPDGAPFFVMERLEGETLATRIARERLSLASAVDMLMQMLSGIAAVHAKDLLVRDLRPQNIYLAHRRGCRPLLKILDFGLARLTPLDRIRDEWEAQQALAGTTTAATATGATAIPYYLSPERTQSEHGIEPVSDLFVAALIFYEALAGERPFVSSSWNGVLLQIAQSRPAPLHDRRPDVSPELSAFVARALSPNPRARPASAKEMQDELRAIFEGVRKSGATSASAVIAARPTDGPPSEVASVPPSMPPPVSLPPPRPPPRPPSGGYEREVTFDDPTERRSALPPPAPALEPEDDETATTRLSSRVREEVDRLLSTPPKPRRS